VVHEVPACRKNYQHTRHKPNLLHQSDATLFVHFENPRLRFVRMSQIKSPATG
jgi:hypothetical protein